MSTTYNPGDVVQLRSGGPLMTVSRVASPNFVYLIYYNTVTGTFDQFFTTDGSLKLATSAPEIPRTGSRPRSSLS